MRGQKEKKIFSKLLLTNHKIECKIYTTGRENKPAVLEKWEEMMT